MMFDSSSVFAYAVGLVLIFVLCRIFIKPLKWLLRLLINAAMGGLLLAAVNFAGGFAGITVVISPLSALLAGLLGIPGVILVILLQYLI